MELRRKLAVIIAAIAVTALLATAIEYAVITSPSDSLATDGTIISQN